MKTDLEFNKTSSVANGAAFQLKGGLYTLTTVKLLTADLASISDQIKEKIKQAPNFFYNAPVILDLKQLNAEGDHAIDLRKLKHLIKECNLILVGLKNASAAQQEIAIQENMAILRENTAVTNKSNNQKIMEQSVQPINNKVDKIEVSNQIEHGQKGNKIITSPVRSGQQIYVPDGDLIITAAVSHGAELLADGNIHVYGVLRGRALAGINGNKEARIFCSSLEAELISIAGVYKISEDFEQQWKKRVEICLDNDRLQINEL